MIEDLWYKNAIIYSLELDTFMDSNGDGVGDFEGLMRRLDYLHWLGVDAIWLGPFYPSPKRDNGYDIADYYGVDLLYGSSGDFVEFMQQAHKRGMRVLVDLVVNHTSSEHPWFQEARSDKDSNYHDWYIWSEKRPPDWQDGMVFNGVQERTWSYDKKARQYYYHRFYDFQPDLNVENPAVQAEIRRIMGYWLALGVAGFRVDAVPFIIETVVPGKKKPGHNIEILSEMRNFLQWRRGDAILLGEANVLPDDNKRYFGADGGGIHMMFNFYVNQHLFYTLATADTAPLVEALEATKEIPRTAQWGQFLRNHDELDLGRLTDEQREKVFRRFAPEETMQLYGRGVRRRLAPMLGDRRHLELAYSLNFSLPGTPIVRFGEEIGMGDDLSLKERYAVRTPMQWSDEPQAGFSLAEKLIHPVVAGGVYGYERVNVEGQRRDPGSFLNWMRRLIGIRKECPEIGWGDWAILSTGCPEVLAMRYDWKGTSLVIVHNFDEKPHEIEVRPQVERGDKLINLFAEDESQANDSGVHRIVLEPHGYRWYRVGDLNYAIYRKKM
jgi:maltose alpha-D-glucosyltransferase / alpha-amylase